ncbi:T9SS type A sorting domain-containing protein [Chitinophaga rupis]|nr:T9SS type A sorting domain-containing protein [Chitinophaga rupis]
MLALAVALSTSPLKAQSPCPLNGSNGNPISTKPVPYTPGLSYKVNTFDWRQQLLTVKNTGYAQYSPITNFFYRPNLPYSQHLALGTASDFRPEDGWELVKRDFGYLADQSNNPVAAPGPYMVLYNKYSGTLRVVAALPGLGANQAINVKIGFKAPVANNPNQANLKVSGLFHSYDAIAASTMDMKTKYTSITTPAVYPGFDYEFFYADFQTNYDPCTCVFESALQVEFKTINQLDVVLSGNLLGISDPIAHYSNGTVVLDQNDDYLASVYRNDAGTATTGMLMYKTLDAMIADYQKALARVNEKDPTILEDMNKFYNNVKTGMDATSFLTSLSQSSGNYYMTVITVVAKLTSFVSSLFKKKDSPSIPPMPYVIHAQMALKGQVTDQRALPGAAFNFATPGSLNASTRPEYNDGVPPRPVPPSVDYPMYNETMGVFSLLEAPKITYTTGEDAQGYGTYYPPCVENTPVSPFQLAYKYRMLFKLKENLKYAFNPAFNVDESKTKIYAAFAYKHNWLGIVVPNCNCECQGYNPVNMQMLEKFPVTDKNHPRPTVISPFLPLDYFSNFKAGMYRVRGIGHYDDGEVSDMGIPVMGFGDSLFVKLLVVAVSKNLDANGQPAINMLSYTYLVPPANIEKIPGDLGATNFVEGGDNISIPSTFFDHDTIIRSYSNIYITDQLITTPGNFTVTLQAQGDIVITNPNVTLNSRFILKRFTPLITPGPAYGAQTATAVSNFCHSGTYQAATAAARSFYEQIDTLNIDSLLRYNRPPGVDEQQTFKVEDPYPNPVVADEVSLKLDIYEPQHLTVQLVDMSGHLVKTVALNKQFDKGTQKLVLSTSDLKSGVYLITVQGQQQQYSRKLVVAK